MAEVRTEKIAALIWEVQRMYSKIFGLEEMAKWEALSVPDQTARMDEVAGLQKLGEGLTAQNLHDIWLGAHLKDGWTYGEKTEPKAKKSPRVLPWRFLSWEQKKMGRMVVDIVNGLSRADA